MSPGEINADAPPALPVRLAYACYRSLLSPLLHAFSPSQCLYLPTCSEYAYVAMVRFGAVRGTWLALRRFARCHPFAKGGLDPVPDPVPAAVPAPVPDPIPPPPSIEPQKSALNPSTHADHLP